MDRWVYSLSPCEVQGDADALVCVVDTSKYMSRDEVACCQIKYLKKMFDYAKKREAYCDKGGDKWRLGYGPNLVDDSKFMSTIAKLNPGMWQHMKGRKDAFECILAEGITKENFAECCRLYNRHKNLWCELDGVKEETNK